MAAAPLENTRHHRSLFTPADMTANARTRKASSSIASGAPPRMTDA